MNAKEAIDYLISLKSKEQEKGNHFEQQALNHAIQIMRDSEWQPIESVPRDGTKFLFSTEGGAVGKGIFTKHRIIGGSADGFRSLDGFYADPTHWKPLPKPPEEDQ